MNSCTNSFFMYEFMCEFVKEFFHEFRAQIYARNSYEFFARKIGHVTNGLYCILEFTQKKDYIMQLTVSRFYSHQAIA